ncbi:MAG: exosortase [Desulfocapsa sp.]|uniref:Exosortase n=1 Tax=Desulfotalea psychrophila TaxID=84980 RepID=A0ABS3AU64_9BACT|nr:exosortase [Desulfocapsa sp.]MBN4068638.1 exosortase [Desulfotalea psychrophila]
MQNKTVVTVLWIAAIGVLIAFVYQATILWMVERYMGADSYYSHGFLVPFISLYFVWQLKDELRGMQVTGSWAGLVLILVALGLHLLGTVLYIFSISGFSLFFLIVGLTLFLFGKEITKCLWFPLLFLLFMFPVPMALISLVSFPLKILVAKAGVWIVALLGIPVIGEGFIITIPAGNLLVGNPCSGLRSLIAFLALGGVMAYMAALSPVKKSILFFCSLPIAVISNLIRVPLLIIVSHLYGLEAAAPDTWVHTASGLLVFVLGISLLLASAKVLEWRN